MGKTLVAYFSCSGVTEQLAKMLASLVGGDLYRIEPAIPYTNADLNWRDSGSRSTIEMKDKKSRPAIEGKVNCMEQYDTVFVGFPIWWYAAPTIINTFLESYDFSGKTVIPFATSGSSGMGDTDKRLHPSCSKETKWRMSKRFPADAKVGSLQKWVEELEI
jgi:flavodoxin